MLDHWMSGGPVAGVTPLTRLANLPHPQMCSTPHWQLFCAQHSLFIEIALKCYFSCLIAQYLQSSLLLNIKLTWNYRQLSYGKNVTSHGFLSDISNKSVWNKAGTELKCKTGIKRNDIPWALA
jgi:hypothetical protein